MRRPHFEPSPSAASICPPRWAWLITTSRKPAAASRSRCQTISGLPPATSSGLGVWSVSGRMRSPRPAARIMAFIGLLVAVADLLGIAFQPVEQVLQRFQLDVAGGGLAGVVDEARQVVDVLVLADAVLEAAEDAEHLEVALQAHQFVLAPEGAEVLAHRQAGGAGLFPVADDPVDFLFLVPGNESVAEERDEVVGDRAVDRVLGGADGRRQA